jgi:hypothetical protein
VLSTTDGTPSQGVIVFLSLLTLYAFQATQESADSPVQDSQDQEHLLAVVQPGDRPGGEVLTVAVDEAIVVLAHPGPGTVNRLLDGESALMLNDMKQSALGELRSGRDANGTRSCETARIVHNLPTTKVHPVMSVYAPLNPQVIAA